jgi:hypothetical protein
MTLGSRLDICKYWPHFPQPSKQHRVFTAKNAKDLPESSFATFAEALIIRGLCG